VKLDALTPLLDVAYRGASKTDLCCKLLLCEASLFALMGDQLANLFLESFWVSWCCG
jgi:hypothetical protein